MKFTQRALRISVLTATIALLAAYSLESFWAGAVAAGGLGAIGWFDKETEKWPWRTTLLFAGTLILVSIGALLVLQLALLLLAVLGALAAWDLTRFQQRMADSPVNHAMLKIEKRHLALLAGTLAGGGILTGIVLRTRLQLNFGVLLVLGIILLISLGQIYRTLRN